MGLRRLAGQGSCPGRPARSVGSASCGVSPRATAQPSNLDADEQKSRCTGDRRRPHCGTCVEAGIICEVNANRLARGPKKGDLKALRSRIGESNRVHFSGSGMRVQSSNNTALPCTLLIRKVALERRLSIDHGDDVLAILTGDSAMSTTTETPTTSSASSEGRSPTLASPCRNQSVWDGEIHVQVSPVTPTSAPLSLSAFQFPPTPPSPPRSTFVDGLMRADLYVASVLRFCHRETLTPH